MTGVDDLAALLASPAGVSMDTGVIEQVTDTTHVLVDVGERSVPAFVPSHLTSGATVGVTVLLLVEQSTHVVLAVLAPITGQEDVTSQFTRVSGAKIPAGGWTALKTGRLITLTATVDGGWAGGSWASHNMLNVPSALRPVKAVSCVFPFHPLVTLEVTTAGVVRLTSSSGSVASGDYWVSISWITA